MEKSTSDSLEGKIMDVLPKPEQIFESPDKPVNKDFEEKEEKVVNNFKQDLKRAKRKELSNKIINFLKLIINPDNWAEMIQNFENLMLVIFVDSFYIALLFSMMYGMYIIINFDNYEWKTGICKFVGSMLISLICIIVHINLHDKQNKS